MNSRWERVFHCGGTGVPFAPINKPADLFEDEVFQKDVQHGDDLGLRMHHSFEKAFTDGYDKICLIGSDNMEITSSIIDDAFEMLAYKDAVFGPSKDGGYYLVGLTKPHKELFENMQWSTHEVLNQTIQRLQARKISFGLLPELNDIDEVEDIRESDRSYLLD